MKLYIYAIGAVLLLSGVVAYHHRVYRQGVAAGKAEVQSAIDAARKQDQARQADDVARLEKSKRDAETKYANALAAMRRINDPSGCYTTPHPAGLSRRLRDAYTSYGGE